MSGFEVAGILLAVLPLIIEGVKLYPKMHKATNAFRRAKQERREFAGQLLLMHTELRCAMINIFKQINISLTVEQRLELTRVDNVGAQFFSLWESVYKSNTDAIEREFEHTIGQIRDLLEDMTEILKEMVRHTDIEYDTGREALMAILKSHAEDKTFSMTKHLAARFRFAKSDSSRRELLERMDHNIKLLEKLNKRQAQIKDFIAAGNLIEQNSHAPYLDKVRIYSNNLYRALSNIWQCSSHNSHRAMLLLETRKTPNTKSRGVRFSVVLSYEQSLAASGDRWSSHETEICIARPKNQKKARFSENDSDDDVNISHLQQVQLICMKLSSCSQSATDALGFVLDDKCSFWGTYPVSSKSCIDICRQRLSLEQVLSQGLTSSIRRLNKRDCLFLAANLASSLLQLHATPWLPENWCDKSIYLSRTLDVHHPYVMVESCQSITSADTKRSFGPNPYLVALGIILLELSERKSFSLWIQEKGHYEFSDNVIEKAQIASEWLDEAYGNMSEEYACAVQHCLSSVFIPVQPRKTLEDEGFREAVFRDIVHRLEREYSIFITPIKP